MTPHTPDIHWHRDGIQTKSDLPLRAMTQPAGALYIHVPFCFHKCHYCDFYSFVDAQDRQADFVEALCLEIGTLGKANAAASGIPGTPLTSIFVGGGTPSLLRPELWGGLLEHLAATFTFAPDLEFTVECNPETVTGALMGVLAAGGVNRISVGAQSFSPAHLTTLERHHDPRNVERALELALDAGIRRLSVDLIFGIPGQTLAEWTSDLGRALRLANGAIEHISCYALTYEPGTAMTVRVQRGDIEPIDQDLEADMFEATVGLLRAAGLQRYEISNFSREGAECRHNLAYWRQDDWLAAGPSASGHASGYRWKNVPRLTDWMDGVLGRLDGKPGYSPVVDLEPPDPRRALAERLLMGLRLREGVSRIEVLEESRQWGRAGQLEAAAGLEVEQGHLQETHDRWSLTDRGILLADSVIGSLMQAIA